MIIEVLEVLGVLLAFHEYLGILRGRRVLSLCDNTTGDAALVRGYSRNDLVSQMVAYLNEL